MLEIELFICIKMNLGFNYLQWLICHKTQTNKQTNKLVDCNSNINLRLYTKITKSRKEKEMNKTVIWIFHVTNYGNCSRDDLYIAKKRKPPTRN